MGLVAIPALRQPSEPLLFPALLRSMSRNRLCRTGQDVAGVLVTAQGHQMLLWGPGGGAPLNVQAGCASRCLLELGVQATMLPPKPSEN